MNLSTYDVSVSWLLDNFDQNFKREYYNFKVLTFKKRDFERKSSFFLLNAHVNN